MQADTGAMRNAADEVIREEQKYLQSIQELENLISTQLKNAWEDDASAKFIGNYESTGRVTFNELDEVLKEFSSKIRQAADELDRTINSLM